MEIIFGAILPTICCLPFFSGMLLWSLFSSGMRSQRADVILGILSFGVPVASILSLWLVVLFGLEQINRHPFARWFILTVGSLGLMEACLFLSSVSVLSWKTVFSEPFMIALIGSVLVGLRFLPRLLIGKVSLE